MGTKDRILEAARALFNAEGAGGLSAVAIASALGISPGHLYYHFKGKGEIAAALMAAFAAEMALIHAGAEAAMAAAGDAQEGLAAFWTHLHIMVEEAHDNRFLYRDPLALAGADASLAQAYRGLARRQKAVLAEALARLCALEAIRAGPEVRDGLAGQLAHGVFTLALHLELTEPETPPRERVAQAAARLMLLVAGHCPPPGPA